jgi:hypothetical protein
MLYGYGRNVNLVSAIYSCSKCGDCLAHNEGIMRQITEVEAGFVLFYQAGLTQDAYYNVVNSVIEGTFLFLCPCT